MNRVKLVKRQRKGSTAVLLDYHDGQKRIQRVFGSASSDEGLAIVTAEAKKEAARIEVQLMDGLYRPSCGDKPIDTILVEFMEHVETSKRRPKTQKAYRNMVQRFRDFLETTNAKRARDLTPELIIGYIQSLHEKAPDTIRLAVSVLNTAFGRAVNRGDMPINPCKHPDVKAVKPESRRFERVFSDDEFEKLLTTAREWRRCKCPDDMADFFLLLGESGLRIGEGLMLRWCDVNLDPAGSFLRVVPHDGWVPKTKTSIRRVPLSPRVDAMIRQRVRSAGAFNPASRVFPETWSDQDVRGFFERVLERAGINGRDEAGDKLRIHSLRHYYASRLASRGVPAAMVRDLCGHGSVSMTDRYFQMPAAALFDAVANAFLANEKRHKTVTEFSRVEGFSGVSSGFGD